VAAAEKRVKSEEALLALMGAEHGEYFGETASTGPEERAGGH
jgi:hypothetical protein